MIKRTKCIDDRKNICFIALGAYSLLAEKKPKNIIGPDVHQALLAKELTKYDFGVSVITYGEGGAPIEHINGIEIIKIQESAYRLRILNIVLHAFRMWNAMRKAKADVYVTRGSLIGIAPPFCQLIRKKLIHQIANDIIVNRELLTKTVGGFSRYRFSLGALGFWLEIKLANAVTVQSEYQKKMLKKNFGRDGVLIKKPFPLTDRGIPEKAKPPIVLWVGAMAENKQPELFPKLAEAIPEARFQMVGGYTLRTQKLYDEINDASQKISNFEYIGVVPFDEINDYFGRASILVNTSVFEAYPPHVFFQAWMNHTPVISLHDNLDELICKYKMGFHSKTFEQLIEDVKTLLKNKALREEMGMNGRKYVEREHDIAKIIGKYIELFKFIGDS